jgi:hypothetical protein
MIKSVQTELGRRYRQGREIVVVEGVRGLTRRARTAAARFIQPKDARLEIDPSDVIAADLSKPFDPPYSVPGPGEPIYVNWVMSPPSKGSGGHTTLFRIINYLEAHGYRNRVYFYDPYFGDYQYFANIVRDYYGFHGPVARVDGGMEDANVVMATAWNTAYAVYNSRCAGKRFYFVQDFEPYFYPAGSISLLAENTYRMGFHAITIGRCFADTLTSGFDMKVDSFNYGSDNTCYRRLDPSPRSGIVFYARPHAPRRGFELGMMALEVFAKKRPDVDIHVYGHALGRLSFPFHDHGHVTPDQLNRLYNQCYAGLSLSFTNVSLVALEMLAAGCIPVVNESTLIRTDVENEFIRYTPPHPHALAAGLEAIVDTPDFERLSKTAAASVRPGTWSAAGDEVDTIIRRTLAEPRVRIAV